MHLLGCARFWAIAALVGLAAASPVQYGYIITDATNATAWMEGEMITRSAATKGPLGKGLYLENKKQMSLYELGGTQEDRTWHCILRGEREKYDAMRSVWLPEHDDGGRPLWDESGGGGGQEAINAHLRSRDLEPGRTIVKFAHKRDQPAMSWMVVPPGLIGELGLRVGGERGGACVEIREGAQAAPHGLRDFRAFWDSRDTG